MDMLLIVMISTLVLYLAGMLIALTYSTAYGLALRRALTNAKFYWVNLGIGFGLLLLLILISPSISSADSLHRAIVRDLPNLLAAAIVIAAAFLIGLLLALGANRLLGDPRSLFMRLCVGIAATLPLLLLWPAVIGTLAR